MSTGVTGVILGEATTDVEGLGEFLGGIFGEGLWFPSWEEFAGVSG